MDLRDSLRLRGFVVRGQSRLGGSFGGRLDDVFYAGQEFIHFFPLVIGRKISRSFEGQKRRLQVIGHRMDQTEIEVEIRKTRLNNSS